MKKNQTIQAVIFGLLMSAPVVSYAQSGRLKYADKLYASQSYYFASEAYEDVLARKTDSSTIAVRIADSYDKIGNTQKAAEWYRHLQRTNQLNREQHLRLALLERQLENYKGSEQLLASYQSKYGAGDVAQNILTTKTTVDALKQDKGWFKLKEQGVNTEHSEIGAGYFSDTELLLSSSKRRAKAVKRVHSWTGNYFYDIYKAPINEGGDIGKLKVIKSGVKSKFHDGPSAYNPTTGYLYFTRNNYLDGKKGVDENKVVRLKLYRGKLEGNKFTNIEELSINDNSFSTAHPSISKDGKRLYFSSDRPGGFGGMDLYYVNLDKDGNPQGAPVNLGNKVNTSQNDLFPFFNGQENLLFFSSEGHFGLGGLDVYVAKLDKTGNAKSIENLGAPINSPYDDFSFINSEDQTKGYVSSNRQGGKGSDDVYGFSQHVVIRNGAILKGNVKDLITDANLKDAVIYLTDKKGNVLDSLKADEKGEFELSLREVDADFDLVAKNDGYVTGKQNIKFDAAKDEYKEDLKLMPVLDYYFAGSVLEKGKATPIEGVKITILDNNKNKSEFAKVQSNNTGAFKSETLPYAYNENINYQFKLEKDGYVTKEVTLKEVLAKKAEINVNEVLSIDMTKIEVGKTDLNDVVDIAPIYFDLNKSDIRPDAAKELDKIVKIMKDNPGMVIELGSHTDSRGSAASNISLSDRRAKSSAQYIISQGIAKDRITGKGYGKSRLKISDAEIAKASTNEEKEALHQKNRRTEFIIVKMK